MIPRREVLLSHLEHFAHACEAKEILLFERWSKNTFGKQKRREEKRGDAKRKDEKKREEKKQKRREPRSDMKRKMASEEQRGGRKRKRRADEKSIRGRRGVKRSRKLSLTFLCTSPERLFSFWLPQA